MTALKQVLAAKYLGRGNFVVVDVFEKRRVARKRVKKGRTKRKKYDACPALI